MNINSIQRDLMARQPSLWDPPLRRSFWYSLDAPERESFAAVAHLRLYPAGAALCQEAEGTSDALVITSGWAKVSTGPDERERILAFRGPGDLVGERTAMAPGTRSAGVVAFDDLTALAISAEQFRVFLAQHPRVVDLLRSQESERAFEDTTPGCPPVDVVPRTRAVPVEALPGSRPIPSTDAQPQGQGSDRTPSPAPLNQSIMFTDIANFGHCRRNDEDRRLVRQTLYRILREAFDRCGLGWDACHQEDRGDGTLTVLPPTVPTEAVVDPLVPLVAAALRRHNRQAADCVRLQMRLALHVGPVGEDADGVHGQALIDTARLLEAPSLKAVMAECGSDLGLITSNQVYRTVIEHVTGLIDPTAFRAARIQVKEADTTGWIYLAGPATVSAPSPSWTSRLAAVMRRGARGTHTTTRTRA